MKFVGWDLYIMKFVCYTIYQLIVIVVLKGMGL